MHYFSSKERLERCVCFLEGRCRYSVFALLGFSKEEMMLYLSTRQDLEVLRPSCPTTAFLFYEVSDTSVLTDLKEGDLADTMCRIL